MKLKAILHIILKNLWLELEKRKKKKKRQEIKMTLQPLKLKIGLLRCETVA